MKKTEIMNKMSRKFGRVGFQLKKHSPEILVVAGVVGTVVSAVMACKATLKVNEVMDESKENLDKIHTATETGVTEAGEEYSVEDGKKDTTMVYVQTGVKLAKIYGPALVVGTLSITSILAGHNMTRKRNVALAAAYAVVDKNFKEYRGRVVERFGEALDKELRYNIKTKEVEEKVIDENGNETTVTKTVQVTDYKPSYSDYAKFFDETCVAWTKDPDYNLKFLKDMERYANDMLKSRGHVFLNEVYDLLTIARTPVGQEVGWIYDEKNPNGDNYIDFGIYNIHSEAGRRFVNGYERSILLDFNVDGPIRHMI
jgi:hypothetical protein